MNKNVLSIILAGLWILASEFIRNEFLFKNIWINHYQTLGLNFETLPVNGVIWTMWSFLLAYLIFRLVKKFSFWETTLLIWIVAFVMMWLTIYNLQVLPALLLIFAIPLSLLEVIVAQLIIRKVNLTGQN